MKAHGGSGRSWVPVHCPSYKQNQTGANRKGFSIEPPEISKHTNQGAEPICVAAASSSCFLLLLAWVPFALSCPCCYLLSRVDYALRCCWLKQCWIYVRNCSIYSGCFMTGLSYCDYRSTDAAALGCGCCDAISTTSGAVILPHLYGCCCRAYETVHR